MTDTPSSGWTPLKVIGLIIGLLGLIGFGLCSLFGIVMATQGGLRDLAMFATFILPGLALTLVSFVVVRAILRNVRKSRLPPS